MADRPYIAFAVMCDLCGGEDPVALEFTQTAAERTLEAHLKTAEHRAETRRGA